MKVLFVSIAPPVNDCGVRVVMHRHLVERQPFDLHVVTDADFYADNPGGTRLTLPRPLHRLQKSRFGPRLAPWLTDYRTQLWPLANPRKFDRAVETFRPDVILALADNCLSAFAARAARKRRIPLAGLFLDWVPIMKGHFGHVWTRARLSRRFEKFYHECDLAFCTSDGMQDVLGAHPNSHVIYPMPGRHRVPETIFPPKTGKFRLAYVGSVENFYGRMICSLIEKIGPAVDLEIVVVGPNADWPADVLRSARERGIYLGFKPPAEAARVLAGADALLVVMSFEAEHRRFMETSFTTKFLDYVAFGKPVILWGPDYCTPARVARLDGGALVVNTPAAQAVVDAARRLAADGGARETLSRQALNLHQNRFNPDRLQGIFVRELEALAGRGQPQ